MTKQFAIAFLVVFVAWTILDAVMHGVVLGSAYASSSPGVFRAPQDMMMWMGHLGRLLSALFFTWIWASLICDRGVCAGLKYGLLFGCAYGVSMGLGSLSSMPVGRTIAVVWCLGMIVEGIAGGLVLGFLMKGTCCSSSQTDSCCGGKEESCCGGHEESSCCCGGEKKEG